MHPVVSQGAEAALQATSLELIKLYTRFAITLNAFDVSARSYEARTDAFVLSTTRNIPPPHRLPMELDVTLDRAQLIDRYRGDCISGACQDFVIRLVSVVDAGLEDILDLSVCQIDPNLPERKRQSKIRGAWGTNDQGRTEIATYLVDTAGLLSPPGRQSTVDMVFDRYCEVREIRNALVHNGAQITDKHRRRLAELEGRLPPELREGSLARATSSRPMRSSFGCQMRLRCETGLTQQFLATCMQRFGIARQRPNPSFEARPNGKPPGPGRWYAVHFHRPGPGVLPSVPPHLER